MRTLLAILFFAGSAHAAAPEKPDPNPLRQAAQELFRAERKVPGILRGAEAHFDFANPENPQNTDRAVLYLHGFSASPVESYPLTENLARRWKANAYFHRFAGHGLEGTEGLRGVTVTQWVQDVRLALDRARRIGKKVVVIATSTGASLALSEISVHPENIEALVLQSPNFGLKAKSSELLLAPYPIAWLLGALVIGPYRSFEPLNVRQALWWTTRYPFTAAIEVMRAVSLARRASLEELRVPTLVLYSSRDNVVNVEKVKEAFRRIAAAKKQLSEVKNAENDHVLTGDILSPSGTAEVEKVIKDFVGP